MKRVHYHPAAAVELTEAAAFYEARTAGLGARFLDEVERGIAAVGEAPSRWPILRGSVRRYLLRPFPYGILYHEQPDSIVILAVMHLHREPGYWKHRL